MFRAIRSGDVGEVLRLLEADPTLLEKQGIGNQSFLRVYMTPVLLAASLGKLDMVQLFVGRGANIHATSPIRGMAALHFAAEKGHEEVVVYLLDNGADPMRLDESGHTPLMWASDRGHMRVVLLLLEPMGGQGLETRDRFGWTALNVAIRGGHEEVVAELLRHGARADTVDRCGTPALRTAVIFSGHVGVVKLLVDHLGTQALHERDREGRSLLHHAVERAKEDMVAYLVDMGLRPSMTDTRGMTPLMYGAQRRDPETVRVLKRLLSYMHAHDIDVRAAIEGRTALHWAVHQNRPANVRALLLAGADPTVVDNRRRTARMRAGEGQRPECVAVLEVGSHMGFSITSRDILH
jgi:ankyrin repeat protein